MSFKHWFLQSGWWSIQRNMDLIMFITMVMFLWFSHQWGWNSHGDETWLNPSNIMIWPKAGVKHHFFLSCASWRKALVYSFWSVLYMYQLLMYQPDSWPESWHILTISPLFSFYQQYYIHLYIIDKCFGKINDQCVLLNQSLSSWPLPVMSIASNRDRASWQDGSFSGWVFFGKPTWNPQK